MVKINFKILYLYLMILVYLILLPTLALASQVAISEIMYNPLGSDTGREWLEVKNVSTSTISLVDGSWRFNDGSSHLVATSSANTFLQPQEYGIIADDPTKFMLDNPSYSGVVYDSSFSLKNSDTKISIFKNGLEDDSVTYSISLGADDNGKTLEYDFDLSQWRASYIVSGTPGAEASIKSANEPPVLQVTLATQAEINKPVKFTAVVTDPENQPVQVKWQFGDDSGGEGVEVVHEYSNDGLYTIVASASDGEIIVYSTSTLKIIETPVSAQVNNSVSGWAKVELSEILPNPSGSETDSEWIELFNNSSDTVSVDRWQIGDNTTRRFTLTNEKQNVQISPYGYLLISRVVSGVSLNNTGEQITLY
ncbi:MAG: lamin tail domain-containing protein, partial [Patescibacteria group bacterium]|nr:lamin tail domain-containing protein [Patescibacteria group bacterium]